MPPVPSSPLASAVAADIPPERVQALAPPVAAVQLEDVPRAPYIGGRQGLPPPPPEPATVPPLLEAVSGDAVAAQAAGLWAAAEAAADAAAGLLPPGKPDVLVAATGPGSHPEVPSLEVVAPATGAGAGCQYQEVCPERSQGR